MGVEGGINSNRAIHFRKQDPSLSENENGGGKEKKSGWVLGTRKKKKN